MHSRCFRTPRLSRRAACTHAAVGLLGALGLVGPRRAATAQEAPSSPCLASTLTPGEQAEEARNALATKVAWEIFKRSLEHVGGVVIDPTVESVLGPLIDYVKDPSKVSLEATANQIVQNVLFDAVKVAFPLYGLVVEAGKFAIGGGLYATNQLLAYGHDAEILATLKGTRDAPLAGRIGNPLADAPLEQYSGMRSRGATLDNLAVTFPKFQDLQSMWNGYVTQMWDARTNQSTRTFLQTQVWPMVEKLWKAQRLEIIEAEFRAELKRQIESSCKTKGVGGLYRGQIPGETSISPDVWGTSQGGATAVLLHTLNAELRLDPTAEQLDTGWSQNRVTGGALSYRAEVTYETYESGTWIAEESFASSAAEGELYTSPDGAMGYIAFTGTETNTWLVGGTSDEPQTSTGSVVFGFVIDDTGQLRLCPTDLQETDLKTARTVCGATAFLTLQPVAENVPV